MAEFGPERVMLGSDYPFDMGEPDPVGALAAARLPEAARAAIEGDNARRFLGLGTHAPGTHAPGTLVPGTQVPGTHAPGTKGDRA